MSEQRKRTRIARKGAALAVSFVLAIGCMPATAFAGYETSDKPYEIDRSDAPVLAPYVDYETYIAYPNVVVNGDVKVDELMGGAGVMVNPQGAGTAASANVVGSIEVASPGEHDDAIGAAIVFQYKQVEANLTVGGDVTAKGDGAKTCGLKVEYSVAEEPSGPATVVVGGTIGSNKHGIVLQNNVYDTVNLKVSDVLDLTAWKIKHGVGGGFFSSTYISLEGVTDAVKYIVKAADQSEMATQATGDEQAAAPTNWKVVKADGTALDTSHGYDFAKVGETIYIVADDGYEIAGAYNDDEDYQTVEYDKSTGKWFMTVQQGGGIDIRATVRAISKVYDVVFQNEDGTVLQKTEVKEGETPAYTGATPTKAADDDYTYAFDAWTPAISKVTKDVTYTATYAKTAKEKPAPAPETKAVTSTAGSSNALPATGDTAPVIPAIATLLLAAAAIGTSRAKLQPVSKGKHTRR